MTQNNIEHNSVMLAEVLEYLEPEDNKTYVDATFGAGGYTKAILEKTPNSKLYAFDRDPEAEEFAKKITEEFGHRFKFIRNNFGMLDVELAKEGVESIDGIVFDLGVSSMQLDRDYRGFSFNKEAKLDMRMSKKGVSAYEVVNEMPEKELADIIYKYGDERKSRHIAKRICQEREERQIETTLELAEIVHKVVGFNKKTKIDSATKTFQAIRIYVNNELGELERALYSATSILAKQARIVVVSFHALEDRIVKNFFKQHSTQAAGSRYMPEVETNAADDVFEILTKGAVKPSEKEIENNPRARSARLRAAVRK